MNAPLFRIYNPKARAKDFKSSIAPFNTLP